MFQFDIPASVVDLGVFLSCKHRQQCDFYGDYSFPYKAIPFPSQPCMVDAYLQYVLMFFVIWGLKI